MVAVDADQGPVELLYRDLRDEGDEQILTLTMNLADPSPGLGWRGLERKALRRPRQARPRAGAGADPPRRDQRERARQEFVDWLASLGAALVIEFPTREDPMVKKLLAPKREGLHPDYELDFFERCLSEAFEVERSERLESGTRVLYFARPKAMSGRSARRSGTALWRRSGLPTSRCCRPSRVAQPLFNLLSDNPEFFAARGSTAFDIISFASCSWCCRRCCCSRSSCSSGLAASARRAACTSCYRGAGGADRRRRR